VTYQQKLRTIDRVAEALAVEMKHKVEEAVSTPIGILENARY